MKRAKQVSESLELGILLALAGGFMDAYSYVCRGHVFANAQTGNVLLLGVNVARGDWASAARYFCPIASFVCGIAIADVIRFHMKDKSVIHWRQISVVFEAAALASVGFMPQSANLLANSLTSFACGVQVESFRKMHGDGMATTMCIGNLRSATQSIGEYWRTRDLASAERGAMYFCVILFFALGAVIGDACVRLWAERAIVFCGAFLLAAFALMFVDKEKKGRR